jgi:tRNA (cmo5U34)-methyltransferase
MVYDFTFDRGVANVFDDMVGRSVPFYDELQRMTVELARNFVQPETSIVDIGCSTGRTLAAMIAEIQDPSVEFIGIDNSAPMLEKAAQRFDAQGCRARCRLVEQDINMPLELRKPSVVIMNWTLQFVRPLHRDAVIRSIQEQLAPQGCLILMEKVLCQESMLNRLYIELYYNMKKRNGYTETEVAQKRESLENVLIPYRVEENLLLLERNGFQSRDVFFRWYNWAGFLGVKAPFAVTPIAFV